MGSQQFCLRWNNHQSNLLNVFEELLERETLVDVTLACEGLSLKAHKVVLSACSPYFQNLFANNPCKHPIVILKDVNYSDLKSVVDFMYKGEINVVHDQLDNLLKVADTLQVKGLAEVTENICQAKDKNDASQSTAVNSVSTTENNNHGRSKQNNRANQPPPSSPPLSKRRKKSHKTSAPVGNSGSGDESDSRMPTTAENDFPIIVKTEALPGEYNNRLCSSDENVEDNENKQSYTRRAEMLAEPRCEFALGTSILRTNERIAAPSDGSEGLDITYTNETLSIEMDPNSSSVSGDISNLPPSLLVGEDVDESVYYPSTSAGVHNNYNPENSSILVNTRNGTMYVNGRPSSSSSRMSYKCNMLGKSFTERMESACSAVAGGLSFRQAAQRYALNAATIWRYYVRSRNGRSFSKRHKVQTESM